MSIQNFFMSVIKPKQIQKIDKYLLLNYPRIWASRVHYVAYYGFIANITFNFLVFFFVHPKNINEYINYVIALIMLIQGGVLVLWIIKSTNFNVEKEFGNTSNIGSFAEIFVTIICIGIINSSSLTTTFTAIYRCARINSNFDGRNFPVMSQWSVQLLFITILIFLMTIRKYTAWSTIGKICIYFLALVVATTFLWITLDVLRIPDTREALVLALSIVSLYVAYNSISLVFIAKFDSFKLINFAVLPAVLTILFIIISGKFISMLWLSLAIYSILYPFCKRVLNRSLSLA